VTPEPAEQDRHGTDGRVLRARGHRTRARLLAAGADVIAAGGLHAARVDDIVRVAKSSHGTFYLYFSSKEDLFEQLVEEVAGDVRVLVLEMPTVSATQKGRDDLRAWLDRFADLYEARGPVIRAWTEAELSGEVSGDQGDAVLGDLVGTLAARLRLPRRAGLDPGIAALALVTMVERLNYYATTQQVDATRDELLDVLVDVFDAALFDRRPARRPAGGGKREDLRIGSRGTT
jgi:AcrR family transcriptional regulator